MPAESPIAPRPRRQISGNATDVINREFFSDQWLDPKTRKQPKPKKHYVLVPKNREVLGQAHYEALGYIPTPLTVDGPRLRGIARPMKPGPVQEYRGCILMHIDMDVWEDIQRYGENNDGGTEAMERLDRLISNPDNVQHQGKYVHESNETKPSEFVLEQ